MTGVFKLNSISKISKTNIKSVDSKLNYFDGLLQVAMGIGGGQCKEGMLKTSYEFCGRQ